MNANDADNVCLAMHQIIVEIVDALFLPGVHNRDAVQKATDKAHGAVAQAQVFLTDDY